MNESTPSKRIRLILLPPAISLAAAVACYHAGLCLATVPAVLFLFCLPPSLVMWVGLLREKHRTRAWITATALAVLAVLGLALIHHGAREWFGTPPRFTPQHLLGRTAADIQRELGKPYDDTRTGRTDWPPYQICYQYGVMRLCRIEFDETNKAVAVHNSSK